MVDFYGKLVGKYTVRPMDGMGSLPETETNSKSHLKTDGWKTFLFPVGARRCLAGAIAVSFREGRGLYCPFLYAPVKET